MPGEWFSRLRFFVAGKSRAEVDEEIAFHMERQVEANLAAGMQAEEARRKAVLSFGGRERTREECRRERPSWSMESVFRDVRYGMRGLARNPGFAAVAVLTLGLAIGANSTVFSLLSQALLSALPVQEPERLVVLSFDGSNPGHTESSGGDVPGHNYEFSYPMYRDLRERNTALSGLIAAGYSHPGAVWDGHAEAIEGEVVSGNYFDVLGVRPAMGRLLLPADETAEGANPVVVLNFDYWKTHLGQAQVIGKTLLLNGTPFTVVGVANPGFYSMVWGRIPNVYVPVTMQHTVEPEWSLLKDRQDHWLNVMGRLRPGVTALQAAAAMNPLFLSLRKEEFPSLHDHSAREYQSFVARAHLNLDGGAKGFSPLRENVQLPLTIMMVMALLVVAMAVVNVASLLLVRAAARGREFAMRYALGATGGQILRQLLTEGLLVAVMGAGMGLLLAPEGLRLLLRWLSGTNVGGAVFTARLDWRVLAFTLAATLTGSLLFSFAPALQFWNPRLAGALRLHAESGRGASMGFRRTCVGLQIGFSLLLIVGAGLFVRTMRNLHNVDPGFRTDHILGFNLSPEMAGYAPQAIAPVEQRMLDAVAALPGVRGVGATNDADLVGDNRTGDVIVSGYTPPPDEDFDVELPAISDGYLQTLGIRLVVGRYFNASDTATSQKVAIVNESFARHFFVSNAAALGRHVSRPHRPATEAVIVGVVEDAKHASVREPAMATEYRPFPQAERPSGLTYYVRTWETPQSAQNSIRAAVAGIDSRLIIRDMSTMQDEIDHNLVAERTIALLAGTFGLLATVLAGIGLYGILAYSTAQRTREIGIRMALGARRGTVVGLILREVLVLAGWAIGITIPIAVLGTHAVRSQLFGVSAADPMVYGGGIMVIAVVAVLAGFIPSRRAATVDPSRALRTE